MGSERAVEDKDHFPKCEHADEGSRFQGCTFPADVVFQRANLSKRRGAFCKWNSGSSASLHRVGVAIVACMRGQVKRSQGASHKKLRVEVLKNMAEEREESLKGGVVTLQK